MPNLLDEHWLLLEEAAAKVGRDKTSLRGPIIRGEIHARDMDGNTTTLVRSGRTQVMFSDVVKWSEGAVRLNRKRSVVQYSKDTTPPTEAVVVVEKDGAKVTLTLPTSEAKTIFDSLFNKGV